jgi:predicted nucleic acid-binding protein
VRAGRDIYLDTNTIIAIIERLETLTPFQHVVLKRVDAGEVVFVSNEIALLECLVKPLRDGNTDLTRTILGFFASVRLRLVPLDRSVILKAAELRARDRLTLPDALHVACALQAGCTVFLSADRRLRVPDGMTRLAFDELMLS